MYYFGHIGNYDENRNYYDFIKIKHVVFGLIDKQLFGLKNHQVNQFQSIGYHFSSNCSGTSYPEKN